ncbi:MULTISPECIES: peptide-methionine (R)-S-oxide reductase MsrB [Sphingobium]|uniref:peptide-methionine (R)-S-oxide reductase n=1 Tax=Sphingobium tyrosinilyticum TaxID=2715436 RepID=A0ABV9EYZ3_9SPHN|nr:peptide-methionine (R)-S-oxide reductase MsrB [Sphingobium sp. EP60837]
MTRRHLLNSALYGVSAIAFWRLGVEEAEAAYPFTLPDDEWRRRLSPLAYQVLRKHATEHPFSSPLNKEHRAGTFKCAGCERPLFNAKTKFDSGTGWPSFWAPLPGATGTSRDFALGYPRVEVHCARCGGHLGHVFDDGPPPTGKRYCMNGVALSFSAA